MQDNSYYFYMFVIPSVISALSPIISNILYELVEIITYFSKLVFVSIKKLFFNSTKRTELYITFMSASTNRLAIDKGSEIHDDALPIIWYLNKELKTKPNLLKTTRLINHDMYTSSLDEMQTYMNMFSGRPSQTNTEEPVKEKTSLIIPTSKKYEVTSIQSSQQKDAPANNYKGKKTFNVEFDDESIQTEISDGIFMEILQKDISSNQSERSEINIVLFSTKKSSIELLKFYEELKAEYEKFKFNKSGKMFIYEGSKQGKLQFSCCDIDKSQTFENIFVSNKNKIISTIKNLENVEFYKKFGLKRKVGQLYVGPPGTGKTCATTAIANMTGRTPVYIPISRITENKEIQKIFYDKCFNGIKYKLDELIFVIDELDSYLPSQKLKKTSDLKQSDNMSDDSMKQMLSGLMPNIVINTQNKELGQTINTEETKNDTFNIGLLLNMLDGNIDQDGMIVVATANSYDGFESGIYRTGRLELIEFEYMGRNDISNMINFYYSTNITPEQYDKIRDDKIIESLVIKNLCISYLKDKNNNIDELIDDINLLKNDLQTKVSDSVL